MAASGFAKLLQITQTATSVIFDDDVGTCLYKILNAGFESKEEILDDLRGYDQCTVISDVSTEIKHNYTNSAWNDLKDQQRLYKLLIQIFKENVTNVESLINAFTKPTALSLLNNDEILTVSSTQQLNKNIRDSVSIDIQDIIIEEEEKLPAMKPEDVVETTIPDYNGDNETKRQSISFLTNDNINDIKERNKQRRSLLKKGKHKSDLDWSHIVQCIKHELWFKLANQIQHIVFDKNTKQINIRDLGSKTVKRVIELVNEIRSPKLSKDECKYIENLVIRSKEAKPFQYDTNRNIDIIGDLEDMKIEEKKDFSMKYPGLNLMLLSDIYNVHRYFLWANYHFKDYDNQQFQQDIINANKCLENKYIPEHVVFQNTLGFYPTFLIDDNLFDIFMYHHGISYFVHKIRMEDIIGEHNEFVVRSLVIPKAVISTYDEDIAFDYDISHIDGYLLDKNLVLKYDRILLTVDQVKNPLEFTRIIEQRMSIQRIKSEAIQKLLIIMDRRYTDKYNRYILYLLECDDFSQYPELIQRYFIGFDFLLKPDLQSKVKGTTTASVYLRFGIDERIRFYPEMLVSLVPRLFNKLSFSKVKNCRVLQQIYNHRYSYDKGSVPSTYRHGWCIDLYDPIFNEYYKLITGFDHISVNYDRRIIHRDFEDDDHSICFRDILETELSTAVAIKTNAMDYTDAAEFEQYLRDNEYDSESIVSDVLSDQIGGDGVAISLSNVYQYFVSKNKLSEFGNISQITITYNAKPQKERRDIMKSAAICRLGQVLSFDKCGHVDIIIDSLHLFRETKFKMKHAKNKYRLMDLITAYDHLIQVHDFYKTKDVSQDDNIHNTENKSEDNDMHNNTKNKSEEVNIDNNTENKSEDDDIHNTEIQNVKHYVASRVGLCTLPLCPVVEKHAKRQREFEAQSANIDAENEDSLVEILAATLNALHTYLLHENQEMYRLKKTNANHHFVSQTTVIETLKTKSRVLSPTSLDFGYSCLLWLGFREQPLFETLHDEIIGNNESSINEKLYLNFLHESLIKKNSAKSDHFTLNDILSLKVYTDTNNYQSQLRKAHWKSTPTKVRRAFYLWAAQLYKANLFHARPLRPLQSGLSTPCKIYHGLNTRLLVNEAFPIYHGPLSTSVAQSVAHTFSEGRGLIWIIKGSYSNPFKYINGIELNWISQYKNEDEVLLYNSFLPIFSTLLFDHSTKKDVDHLLYILQTFQDEIEDPTTFFMKNGLQFDNGWLELIKIHHDLYNETQLIRNDRDEPYALIVLERLVVELKIKELRHILKIHLSRFKLKQSYMAFGFCTFGIGINNQYEKANYCFLNTQYKIVNKKDNAQTTFKYDDEVSVRSDCISEIFVQNKDLYGVEKDILLQTMDPTECFAQHRPSQWKHTFATQLCVFDDKVIGIKNPLPAQYKLTNVDEDEDDDDDDDDDIDSRINLILMMEYGENPRTQVKPAELNDRNYVYEFVASSTRMETTEETEFKLLEPEFIIPYSINGHIILVYVQVLDSVQPSTNYTLIKVIPIKKVFKSDTMSNRVDHLLQLLSLYENEIVNKDIFYRQIGITWDDEWLQLIKKRLFASKLFERETTKSVLQKMVDALQISGLEDTLTLYKSEFESHGKSDALLSLNASAPCFTNTIYKVVQKGNPFRTIFEIFLSNPGCFGCDNDILLQTIGTQIDMIEQCNCKQTLYILKQFIMPKMKISEKLESLFLSYFVDNRVNGSYIQLLQEELFAEVVITYCNTKNNLYEWDLDPHQHASTLWELINNFNFKTIREQDLKAAILHDIFDNNEPLSFLMKQTVKVLYFWVNEPRFTCIDLSNISNKALSFDKFSVSWNNKPTSISQCSSIQLSYILIKYLLKSDKFEPIQQLTMQLDEFMIGYKYNGSVLKTIEPSDFGDKLTKYLGYREQDNIKKAATELYMSLMDFDLLDVSELKQTFLPSISTKNLRTKNKLLQRLNQNDFCDWVVQCAKELDPSNSVQNIQNQIHQHPADVFRSEKIDGEKYCQHNSKSLMEFLKENCGYKAGAARPLIRCVDRYPCNPTVDRK